MGSTDNEQQAFVFKKFETGIAAIRSEVNKGLERAGGKCPQRSRKGFAPHLEWVEVVIEPKDLPGHEGKQKVLTGEDVSERLDVVPARFRVIVIRRPKYVFKNKDGVVHPTAQTARQGQRDGADVGLDSNYDCTPPIST
ncbi:transposase IS66-like protein [Martelella mediterranea]|uniref:Transposase IS66-like protein n=1 Tax=Martelella mediterranea TaxID=293089 RepID=A0A4R3NC36_9HYPH|nr:transposase IS66-like protein [Martelella mediterranea]